MLFDYAELLSVHVFIKLGKPCPNLLHGFELYNDGSEIIFALYITKDKNI